MDFFSPVFAFCSLTFYITVNSYRSPQTYFLLNHPYQVELADKLPHVQSLCIHEMVVRAYKHILQAVLAAVDDIANMASSIASCLNLLLGTPAAKNGDADVNNDDELKWKWVEKFLFKRFGWQWKDEARNEIRKFAILRGLCHKVS